jgi:endoglucanase
MLNQILALSDLTGVSSWEDQVREYIIAQAKELGAEVQVDALGNVIARKKGKQPAAKTILLTAHMDEVGLMVSGYEEDGCLRFQTVGQVDRRCLIGKGLLVGEHQIPGVIGIKAIHLTNAEERKKTPATKELYIDIGAHSKEEAQKLVQLGEACAFRRNGAPFGNGLVKAPALTRSIPCAILLSLLAEELPVDCTFAFTVQKEVESRGAFGVGFSVKPDVAFVVDTTGAKDVPGLEGDSPKLGSGVVLAAMDDNAIYDRTLFRQLLELAKRESLPVQCQGSSGDSQAGVLQRSRAGAPVMAVKVPVRYERTPANVANLDDCRQAKELLLAAIEQEVLA